MIVRTDAELFLDAVDDERADDRADRAGCEDETDLPWREVQHAQRIENEDREAHAPEQVRRARAGRDAPQVRIAVRPS